VRGSAAPCLSLPLPQSLSSDPPPPLTLFPRLPSSPPVHPTHPYTPLQPRAGVLDVREYPTFDPDSEMGVLAHAEEDNEEEFEVGGRGFAGRLGGGLQGVCRGFGGFGMGFLGVLEGLTSLGGVLEGFWEGFAGGKRGREKGACASSARASPQPPPTPQTLNASPKPQTPQPSQNPKPPTHPTTRPQPPQVDLNDAEPAFLKGHSARGGGAEMSPVKIVKNPDGSMQRAAMTQGGLAKERRELREQQQRTLLEAIPKDISR